jgi:uncharacterized membrane protein
MGYSSELDMNKLLMYFLLGVFLISFVLFGFREDGTVYFAIIWLAIVAIIIGCLWWKHRQS